MARASWFGSTAFVLLIGATIASGCGDDDDDGTPATGGTAGTGGTETGGSGTGGEETGGSGTGGSATGGSGTGGGGGQGGCSGTQLTVINTLEWCDVTIAGSEQSSVVEQTVCVPDGEVELTATPNAGFRLGSAPWHGTDGDTGDGEEGDVSGTTSTAIVTVSGDGSECVWVCCEFASGGGCDIENPCP